MCGIAGIISNKKIDVSCIGEMTNLIRHRGPDDEGFVFLNADDRACVYGGVDTPKQAYSYTSSYTPKEALGNVDSKRAQIAFGHRRLSIVDLSPLGHQPMCSVDQRYWIVFNGEIYNHPELRKELEGVGYQFQSHADTEVIMAAYDHWGAECLNRFNGMWAFVLYDTHKNKIFISRDRFGKKPLFYMRHNGAFYFASEIKSFMAIDGFDLEPNINFLENYIINGCHEWARETAFLNIYRYDHASYIEATSNELLESFQEVRFWEVRPNTSRERFDSTKAQEYADQYYLLLEDAVRIRLRADVKLGSALSGGHDSSSIVYLVNRILQEQGKTELQETFSCVYNSPGTEHCDESLYIQTMADYLGVHSNQIEPHVSNIPEEHEKMIWAMDNPPDSTCMSSWHTFQCVANSGVKVTLDGQGADEQLGGYLHYITVYLASLFPVEALKEAWALRSIPGAKRQIRRGLLLSFSQSILGKKLSEPIARRIVGKSDATNLNTVLSEDTMTNLVTLIHSMDRESMAHSVESRMPFLDYRLVEFLASVPACYKLHNGWTKYLARLAFDKKIPDEVCWRKDKMGWPIPEEVWLSGPLSDWFQEKVKGLDKLSKTLGLPLLGEAEFDPVMKVQSIRRLNLKVWCEKYEVEKGGV